MNRILLVARERTEILVLVGVTMLILVSFGSIPIGVALSGLLAGAILALHAAGIVLVYKANRVINFAQLQIGSLAGLLFVRLVEHRPLLHGLRAICPPCLRGPSDPAEALRSNPDLAASLSPGGGEAEIAVKLATGWLVQLNYWLSALLSLAFGVLCVWLLYVGIVKRLKQAPRLLLTVLIIGAGHLALGVGSSFLDLLFPAQGGVRPGGGTAVPVPIGLNVTIGPAVFGAAHILTLLATIGAVAYLRVYLRKSDSGVQLRAAADNSERAQTLGINLTKVTARAWIVAGVLGGIASLLVASMSGAASFQGYDQLVRVLAAAIVGGLGGLPLTFVAAGLLGVIDQGVLWHTGSQTLVSGLILLITVGLLLAQRARTGRAEAEGHAAWEASRDIRPIPAELRSLATVKNGIFLAGAAGAVVALGYPWFMSPSQTSLAHTTMAFGIVGLSLLVLTGWAGQISLGQFAFAGIGAWIAAVSGLPMLLAIVAGAFGGMVVATLIGLPALRLRGLHLAITTLALSVATWSILLGPDLLGRLLPPSLSRPVLLGIDFEDSRAFYYLMLLCLILAVAGTMGMRRSRTARALIAAKDNEIAAQSFGINLLRARLGAFAISGAMSAFAGGLLAYAQHGVQPQAFLPTVSVEIFLMTIIGGVGSVAGPVLGAVYLGVRTLLEAGGQAGRLLSAVIGPGLGTVAVLLFMPGGLSEVLFGIRDAWLRRLATRRGIWVPTLMGTDASSTGRIPIASPSGTDQTPSSSYVPDGQWMIEAAERGRADA